MPMMYNNQTTLVDQEDVGNEQQHLYDGYNYMYTQPDQVLLSQFDNNDYVANDNTNSLQKIKKMPLKTAKRRRK